MLRKKKIDWKDPLQKRKYWDGLKKRSKPLQRKTPIRRTGIKPKPPKKKKTDEMFQFLLSMVKVCTWVCAECGKPCYTGDLTFQLAAQAHLLPKKTFRSVAMNPDVIVCMPKYGCGHHGTYDASWLRASKMKSWPRFKQIIFTKLVPLLPPHEYSKLPLILRDEYEKNKK